jgi:serine protease Do
MRKTLYDLLGLARDADPAQIAAACTEVRARLDQGDMDRNESILLRDACEILSSPKRRELYDASLNNARRKQGREIAVPEASAVPWKIIALLAMGLSIGVVWWSMHQRAPQVLAPVPLAPSAVTADPANIVSAPAPAVAPVAVAPLSMADLYAQLAPNVARIDIFDTGLRQIGTGSGVALGGDTMITNCHVAKAGASLRINIGGRNLLAAIDVADEDKDLCLLKVAGLRAAPMSIDSAMRPGQKVFAIGAPHGLDLTISDGIISSLREVDGGSLIQTTAPISPGSSGGGLFNESGRLIGIVTFQDTTGQNLNFAAPAEWISQIRPRKGDGLIAKLKGKVQVEDKTPADPAAVFEGRWRCHSVIGGKSFLLSFMSDRVLGGEIEGRRISGRYFYSSKVLYLDFDGNRMAVPIEYVDREKIVFFRRPGERNICARE